MRESPYFSELHAVRNPDGGWGYYPGKASRLEPTSLALIAWSLERSPADGAHVGHGFSRAEQPAGERRVGGMGTQTPSPAPLLRFASQDGLLHDAGADVPNIAFNAQAALAFLALGDTQRARVITDQLLVAKAEAFPNTETNSQDNRLIAWPWRSGTAGWVEPTAWCLLAVKRVHGPRPGPAARERVDLAERMLADRMCLGGGWNYGNSVVLGRALPAHLPTTALALLALADRPSMPAVTESLAFLSGRRLAERSGLTLSLARICLQRYGVSSDDLGSTLAETWAATSFMHNVPATALAAIASVTRGDAREPFHV
jgi:hypothetical protein